MPEKSRIIAILAATLLGLTACGAAESNDGGSKAGAGTGGGKKFVWVGAEDGDPASAPLLCGAQQAGKASGAEFTYKHIGNGFTPALQIPVLQAAAATKPDGIIISPASHKAMTAPVNAIVAKGIPVVSANQQIDDPSKLASQVVMDNVTAGSLAADYLAKRANGQAVQVAVESFTQGASTAADGEVKGFEEQIKKYPNITYVGARYGDVSTSTYVNLTSATLARYPKLFGVFTTFSNPAEAAVASIASKHTGTLVVAGYAGEEPKLVQDLQAGTIAAIVDFDWKAAGKAAATQIMAAADGGRAEATVTIPAKLTTKDDAASLNGAATC